MDISLVIDYLVDQGEFVEEEHTTALRRVLAIEEKDELQERLLLFFKKEFPEADPGPFFSKYFPTITKKSSISIIKSFEKTPSKRTVKDFVKYFTVRFRALENLLKYRSELSSLISISRIKGKSNNDLVSIIGMVLEKDETMNGHIMLTMEDLSGTIKVLIHKDNKELHPIANDLVLDEVIGLTGNAGKDIIFAKSIIFPDVPLSKELKKSPLDHYALFFGDFHVGSNVFLKKEFFRVLLWLNGKIGSLEQRTIAKKVKYIFIVGDVIEGVGIYPNQDKDLDILSCRGQYQEVASLLKKIPPHIKIVICPGNHDVGRIAEPQLPISKEYAPELWDLPNVVLVSNPAYISVDITDNFSGIDVLLYHGYSLIYYSDAIPSIRAAGGQKVADDIMIHLLRRRHLAPSHGSTLYVPDTVEDPLVIDPIPDIFVTGHIHRTQTKNYRNVTCINSSGWTAITEDQEKRGLEPQPGRIIAVSLKTREIKVMNFNSSKEDFSSVAAREAFERAQKEKREQTT